MAKIKLGSLVTDIRNKLDGIVFSKNTFGRYVRIKVTPVNPQSVRQMLVRGRLDTLAKRYANTLEEGERILWRDFAANNPRTDVFGDTLTLTGITMYQALNLVLLNSGNDIIDVPPANLDVIPITSTAVTIGNDFATLSLAFTPTPSGTDTKVYIFATSPLSAGVNFFKPKWRFLKATTSAIASPLNLLADYTAKFGVAPVGSKIAFLVAFENQNSGALSVGLITSAIVPTEPAP